MPKPHSILFVLSAGLTLSGVTTWTIGLSRQLVQMGQTVGLVKHGAFGPALPLPIPDGARLVECHNQAIPYGFYDEQDIADFLSDYRGFLPATIILNGGAGSYATCAMMSLREAETMRVIGLAHADEAVFYEWLSYYEPLIHKFVAVSREIEARLHQRIPHRQADIVMRPYPVEVNPLLKRSYSLQPAPLQLMYAGRMEEPQKRVSDLIRLIKALAVAQVNFQFRLVGYGPATPSLLHQIEQLEKDTRQRVNFVGTLPPADMAQAWQTADICILVSAYEGTSIAMLEAMAQGCVPVVTQVSGTAEVIRHGVNGLVVPVGQIEEMARHIQTLDQQRGQLLKLGTAAQSTILERFTYPQYGSWFLDLSAQAWQQPPRIWPTARPLSQQPTIKENLNGLSGEQLSHLVPTRKLIKALGFKVTALPTLQWLYRFRGVAKKLLESHS